MTWILWVWAVIVVVVGFLGVLERGPIKLLSNQYVGTALIVQGLTAGLIALVIDL